ncbi:MAG: ABC transporter permease [Butyrivibrio sp.]|nr:ABC transporter permease [Butyrivibrio sp.]
MKNWLKILKFTLKQAFKGKKYILSTVIVGIVLLIVTAVTNFFVSGAFDNESKTSNLKSAYIVNNTDLSLDTEGFINKNQDNYSGLSISIIDGKSAEDAAADPAALGENEAFSLVLEITEDEDDCDLTAYIPEVSTVSGDEAYDFAKDFSETVKNAKIKSTGLSEDKLNMAIGDIDITQLKAEEADEQEEFSLISYLAPTVVMFILYILVLLYGQAIGQVVSMEKTSKLMEYILTLSGPEGLIFGKVTAVFLEAVIQIAVWTACCFCGFTLSNGLIAGIRGGSDKNIITEFINALPEGSFSYSFATIMIWTVVALLVAFLFYCFYSALFASFAATADDVSQTNAISLMTMMFGFLFSFYVPMFTDNSKIGLMIIRIIPVTSAFALPADIIRAKIGIVELIVYLVILIIFTVLLGILTGRVYKNRLFKKGTKGIWAEITAAITGKASVKTQEPEEADSIHIDSALTIEKYVNQDKARKAYTVTSFALVAFMLASNVIGSGFFGSILANIVAGRTHTDLLSLYENTTFTAVLNIIAMYLIAFPVYVLVMKFTNDSCSKVKGPFTKGQYLRAICMCFPVMYVLSILSNTLASWLSGGESDNALVDLITSNNILAVIMIAVLAPIFEELIFRKFMIDRLRRYGEFTAIMFSSVAFGLFHCNIYQLFYAFVLGLILAYVYTRSGNVILTIIMHMIVNSSSAVLYPLSPVFYQYFYSTMVVLGVIAAVYTFFIKKDVKLKSAKYDVLAKELSPIAFRNCGVLIFDGLCLLLMVYNFLYPLLYD